MQFEYGDKQYSIFTNGTVKVTEKYSGDLTMSTMMLVKHLPLDVRQHIKNLVGELFHNTQYETLVQTVKDMDKEILDLRRRLHVFADMTETSYLSYDGKNLLGDRKSIDWVKKLMNAETNLEIVRHSLLKERDHSKKLKERLNEVYGKIKEISNEE